MYSNIIRAGEFRYNVLSSFMTSNRYEISLNQKGKLEVHLVPCDEKLKLEISSN